MNKILLSSRLAFIYVFSGPYYLKLACRSSTTTGALQKHFLCFYYNFDPKFPQFYPGKRPKQTWQADSPRKSFLPRFRVHFSLFSRDFPLPFPVFSKFVFPVFDQTPKTSANIRMAACSRLPPCPPAYKILLFSFPGGLCTIIVAKRPLGALPRPCLPVTQVKSTQLFFWLGDRRADWTRYKVTCLRGEMDKNLEENGQSFESYRIFTHFEILALFSGSHEKEPQLDS